MSYYTNMALNEGEQAKTYKRRKEEEERNAREQEHERFNNRNGYMGDGHGEHIDVRGNDQNSDNSYENAWRRLYASNKADSVIKSRQYGRVKNRNINNKNDYYSTERTDTEDAILRHNRRHPDRYIESGIFSECYFIEFAY